MRSVYDNNICIILAIIYALFQVKKTDKESFKKKNTWQLRELLVVDGRDENKVSIAACTKYGYCSYL